MKITTILTEKKVLKMCMLYIVFRIFLLGTLKIFCHAIEEVSIGKGKKKKIVGIGVAGEVRNLGNEEEEAP